VRSLKVRALVGMVVALVIPIVSSCGQDKECSGAGGVDGVRIGLPTAILSTPHRIVAIACVDGRCARQNYDRLDRRFPTAFVSTPMPDDAPAHLRISVTIGKWHARGVTTVHTRSFMPNGPGCPPTVWYAATTFNRAGHLRGTN
jgi:hypothetical protein